MIYFAFNKPFGVLSQFTPADGHPALDSFGFPPDIYPAGRLDRDSEGLLFLTNDGELIQKMTHPQFKKPKTYLAQLEKIPSQLDLEKLKSGPVIKNYKCLPCQAHLISRPSFLWPRTPPIRERKNIPTSWIEITIREGKNRQVRKMTAAIGYPTLRLIRISIGKLTLDNLKPGEKKELTKKQVYQALELKL